MATSSVRLLGCFLLGLVQGASACSGDSSSTDSSATDSAVHVPRIEWTPPEPVDVVFIVVDTLRADALLDPGERYDTPNLDRLGREGVVFPRAFSAAPMTLPSHMSLFSSRPPFETKILNNGQRVPQDLPLLADWLGQNGYHTRGVISLATLNPVDKQRSSSRGFDSYDIDYRDIALAEHTKTRLFGSLAQRDATRPLFLFAHFADPHEPYDAHGSVTREVQVLLNGAPLERIVVSDTNQWTREMELPGGTTVFEFAPVTAGSRFRVRRFECFEDGKPVSIAWEGVRQMQSVEHAKLVIDRGDRPAGTCLVRFWLNDEPTLDDLRNRYALEVAYVDGQIGELLTELDRLGLYSESLVVFTSDHGEGLGDHELVGHVERLSDELIQVPMIIKLPDGDPRGPELERAARGVVTHLDVVPTLLEIVGSPPLPGQRGTSLFEPHESVHIAQTHRPEARRTQLALRDERFKMVYFPADPEIKPRQGERFELYDLAADPGERRDVFAQRGGERPEWPARLRHIYELSSMTEEPGATEESEEERRAREEMLQALGYGGGSGDLEE
jgi:arylsulfatase A-like enzyme